MKGITTKAQKTQRPRRGKLEAELLRGTQSAAGFKKPADPQHGRSFTPKRGQTARAGNGRRSRMSGSKSLGDLCALSDFVVKMTFSF